MKVCSLYGEGFFYIPGTDTCIKIGGWVRAEVLTQAGGSHSTFTQGAGGNQDRVNTADSVARARTVVSFDVRTQTEYGTLRSYYRGGFDTTTGQIGTTTLYTERAFVQFAGFTFGKTQSYFDFFAGAFSYGGGYLGAGGSSTGATGTLLAAYTAQFGNGFSATLSVEDNTHRRNALWDATDKTNGLAIGGLPGPGGASFSANTGFCSATLVTNDTGGTSLVGCATGDYAAPAFPDIVGNLRVDQAWGSAQVAGALHQVRAGFYGNNTITGNTSYTGVNPPDKWGWAVLAGIVVNLPWAQGDKFWVEGAYAQGAPSYVGYASNGLYSFFNRFNGNHVAAAWALDAVFAATPNAAGGALANFSGLQLSSSWSVNAAVEHYWTPSLRTAWFGSFAQWDPGSGGNAIMCSSPSAPVRTVASGGLTGPTGAAALPGCDFKFTTWGFGTRHIWNPVKNLDIGLEVMYAKVETNFDPGLILLNFGGSGARAAGFYSPSSEGAWSGVIRVQRNFWP